MKVEVRGTDANSIDRALAEFKKKVKKNEILIDLRKHEHFMKPSMRRKHKKLEALKRRRREEREALRLKGKRYE